MSLHAHLAQGQGHRLCNEMPLVRFPLPLFRVHLLCTVHTQFMFKKLSRVRYVFYVRPVFFKVGSTFDFGLRFWCQIPFVAGATERALYI